MVAVLAGCSNSGVKFKNPVTITVWTYYNGDQLETFNSLVDKFNEGEGKKMGVTAESSSQGSVNDLETNVLASVEGKVGADEMPNIFSAYADTAYTVDQMGKIADISGYLEKYVLMGNAEALWSFGFNLSNIGSKISYDGGNTNQYLPAKLTLGTGLLYPIDDYNQIGVYLDLNKYMVPYAPQKEEGETDADYQTRVDDYKSWSSLSGMLKSFTDSPNGLLKEIMVSVGAEYSYNQQFFVRGGYFYENANVGNRKYFSVGAGFRMSVFQLDAAYLISTVPQNPLDQTLRFSLSFDMDGIKNLFR